MLTDFNEYIFLGGGVMAERLYGQLHSLGLKLIGVADTLGDTNRVRRVFMEHEVQPLMNFSEKIKNGEVAVILAINAFESFAAIDFYLKSGLPEELLYVPNPYTSLRPCVMNDEFAAEQRIPLTDERYNMVGDLFEDELSKKTFQLLVESKTYDNKEDTFELVPYKNIKEMYWCSEDYWQSHSFESAEEMQDATVIDCGAYIGDSIIPLCDVIPQGNVYYYAFEPDEENATIIRSNPEFFDACKELHVMEYGVGNQDTKMYFELPDSKQKDAGRFVDNPTGNEEMVLEIRRMDGLELDIRGTAYIKMDIEGSELSALEGAADIIKEHKPYLAICVYHRKNDLITIPLYIKSLVSDYQFYLRGGFHTILWAIPKTN